MTDSSDQLNDLTPAVSTDVSEDRKKGEDLGDDSTTNEEPTAEQDNSHSEDERRSGEERRRIAYRMCEEHRTGKDRRANTEEQ